VLALEDIEESVPECMTEHWLFDFYSKSEQDEFNKRIEVLTNAGIGKEEAENRTWGIIKEMRAQGIFKPQTFCVECGQPMFGKCCNEGCYEFDC
jgi:hypothetical protein